MKQNDIIQGCQRNDRKSQRAFVDEYSKYLYTVCVRYMNDHERAKDCLQESLVHILHNIKKYKNTGSFKSWIARVSSNICLQELRKEKKHEFLQLEEHHEPSVEESISKTLEAQDVINLLNRLPEKYRIVLNLFMLEDYTHKEISQVLNIKESSSRSLVARARKLLNTAISNIENKNDEQLSISKKIKKLA